jgi:hypothetical protein
MRVDTRRARKMRADVLYSTLSPFFDAQRRRHLQIHDRSKELVRNAGLGT